MIDDDDVRRVYQLILPHTHCSAIYVTIEYEICISHILTHTQSLILFNAVLCGCSSVWVLKLLISFYA